MNATTAFLGLFGDALDFIAQPRESVSGGVQIGGPAEVLELTWVHIKVSVVAIVAAVVLFLPLGLYLGHRGRGEFLASSVSNVGRAVPTLALLAFFLSFLGIGFTNVAFVLFLLAVPPIFTNTFVGVSQVDKDTVDAAKGMGMTNFQVIRNVELPLALPTIFAGIRLSTVAVLATATIGPLANVFTLGTPIIEPQTYGPPGQLAAALLVAVVTVLGDQIVRLIQRLVTPAGIRLEERSEKKKGSGLTLNPLRRESTT
ncbi:ABC transporter permease [Thermoleophilia bacterium SCSIO 60948]|nr:ABC transporter permease [Thermoleophilia bacterium SCSIO 60948]